MGRFRVAVLLVAVLAMVGAACGDTDEGGGNGGESCELADLNLVEPGKLTIATGEPVFPPWMIDDDPTSGEGFESAVAYAIANEMGFADADVNWVRTTFEGAITAGPKDFDFNIQQYSITSERDEVVDFSDPYYTASQALVAYPGSEAENAQTIADLKGVKFGAAIGTTSLNYIEDVIQPDSDAAVYDSTADAKSALDANQIDALVFDLPTAYFITAVEIPEASIIGILEQEDGGADQFGLLFEEGNSLVACVNDAIAALDDNGTLDDLAEEWLAGAGEIRTITQ